MFLQKAFQFFDSKIAPGVRCRAAHSSISNMSCATCGNCGDIPVNNMSTLDQSIADALTNKHVPLSEREEQEWEMLCNVRFSCRLPFCSFDFI